MKKILILFICLFYFTCLIGCNNAEDKKLIVEFIIEDVTHNVEIDKGSKLVKDMVPITVKNDSIELYYDENFTLQKTQISSDLTEFEIICQKGNILPVLIEFNTNSLEKIYAGKLFPITDEFSVHSAFCSFIYQKLLRCSFENIETSNDFCRYFNWNKFYESILKFENPFLLDSDLICYDISTNQFSARSLKLKE